MICCVGLGVLWVGRSEWSAMVKLHDGSASVVMDFEVESLERARRSGGVSRGACGLRLLVSASCLEFGCY